VLDASAEAYERIYVSGGKRGLDIALTPRDLLEVTGGSVAPISR
jgi:Cys-tRNA(Pro)/Cys-tRNA(Cys) deacylase